MFDLCTNQFLLPFRVGVDLLQVFKQSLLYFFFYFFKKPYSDDIRVLIRLINNLQNTCEFGYTILNTQLSTIIKVF